MIEFSDLEEILVLIQKQYGYDFSGYSRASLLRRINRFMEISDIGTIVHLKNQLVNDPDKFNGFINEIVVNISEFFRDPDFFKSLLNNVFPYLESYPKINIWTAGCSFGEETYSLAILLKEMGLMQKSRIYATDISAKALEKAKKGIFPNNNFKEYSNNYFSCGAKESFNQYFVSDGQKSIINSELKKDILFSRHNLVTDGVFKECQLILCRNVLIYFDEELQNKVLQLFYDSLPVYGFLALGNKETLRFSAVHDKFKIIDKKEKIYQKIK
ncbi:CheR family methyltransferase [Flavobacterium urumqiense]|uniref:Chemotaxis protein methyltransferase CheR n=1 Tax=Flavobacterium urumqiense TaxID=935224 RepID=A0A1H5WE21_9FLAO|nr:protein-glutamate O-methyltransferase CheR [Flavobacterium urumqiense]SEF97712.1 chemotaxis protein methyltransferase CheR [Flavobacterium urumqiense]